MYGMIVDVHIMTWYVQYMSKQSFGKLTCNFCIAECTSGTVRLVGGPNVRAGRVEFCYQGIWGTLTDDSWGTRDAKVICSMLGFFPGRE